jgi:hypothetical protein
MAEVVMPATVPVARNIVWSSADCSFGTINWHVVVRRLMVTREESVATPMVMPLDAGREEIRRVLSGWLR